MNSYQFTVLVLTLCSWPSCLLSSLCSIGVLYMPHIVVPLNRMPYELQKSRLCPATLTINNDH